MPHDRDIYSPVCVNFWIAATSLRMSGVSRSASYRIKTKRLRAGSDHEYLLKLIGG
jgi:hypothetical protein